MVTIDWFHPMLTAMHIFMARTMKMMMMLVMIINKSFERSIYFKGAREWNNLDINTRNIPTLALFKQHQKCWLKSTVT